MASSQDMDFTPTPRPDPNCECAVCYDELGSIAAHWTCSTCAQTLHSDCWSRWALQQPTCPLCRASASFRRYD
jgi:hypothetical protein